MGSMFHALLNPVSVVLPSGGYEPFLLGNLLAGLVEYGVLRWRFGLQGFRWLVILVVVNACSAAIGGYPLQTWLPTWISRLNLGPLDQVPVLLLSAALLTFLLALLMELPAYFAIFRLADVRRRQPIRALLVAHLVSWPVTLGLAVYLSRHEWDLSLYARTSRVSVSRIAPSKTWIWFERDGRIYKQKIGDFTVQELTFKKGDMLMVRQAPGSQEWCLGTCDFDRDGNNRFWSVAIAPAGWVGPIISNDIGWIQPIGWGSEWNSYQALHGANFFSEENASRRTVITFHDRDRIELNPSGKGGDVLRSYSPWHRAWFWETVTLPDGPVLVQMDQGIVLLEPMQKNIASVGRGRLVMVLREP